MKKLIAALLLMLFALPQFAAAENAPSVTITFDKDTVAVGEEITATYEINCPKGFHYGNLFWQVGSDEDDIQCPEGADVNLDKEKGSVSLVPTFGERLRIQISFDDLNGEPYTFFSEFVPVTGDQSKEPTVKIVMDKEAVTVGETITATYEVSGEGNYTEIKYEWCITTNDGWSQDAPNTTGKSEKLTGDVSYIPEYGDEIYFYFQVKEDNGRWYEYWGKNIAIEGDQSIEPDVTIILDKSKVAIGEALLATYQIFGEEQYQDIEYGFYHQTEYEWGEIAPVGAYGSIEAVQGSISFVPRFGYEISFHLSVQNEMGRQYRFESEWIPISGFADNYDIYTVIEGENTQISDGTNSLTFRADGAFEKYLGVQVDGKTVPKRYVTAWPGSTYVELSKEYLASLEEGEHELTIIFDDGVAVTTFSMGVLEEETVVPDLPQTGDNSALGAWAMLLAAAAVLLTQMKRAGRMNG